jgi:alpha-amylase
VLRRGRGRVEARLSREGSLGPYRIRVAKTISLSTGDPNTITTKYELSQLPREVPIHFGVEFNFAAMPAGAQDRYYYDQRGRRVGDLGAQLQLPRQERLGMVDEWLGLDVCLDTSVPADIWSTPIQTVSQSEAGFELIHQSCAVMPHWQFFAGEDGRWEVTLTLSIDSSAAQARLLSSAEARPEGRLTLTGA